MKWEKTTQKLKVLHFIKYYLDDRIDEVHVNELCSTHGANDKNRKIRSNSYKEKSTWQIYTYERA